MAALTVKSRHQLSQMERPQSTTLYIHLNKRSHYLLLCCLACHCGYLPQPGNVRLYRSQLSFSQFHLGVEEISVEKSLRDLESTL